MKKILTVVVSLGLVVAVSSCTDDEVVKLPETKTEVREKAKPILDRPSQPEKYLPIDTLAPEERDEMPVNSSPKSKENPKRITTLIKADEFSKSKEEEKGSEHTDSTNSSFNRTQDMGIQKEYTRSARLLH